MPPLSTSGFFSFIPRFSSGRLLPIQGGLRTSQSPGPLPLTSSPLRGLLVAGFRGGKGTGQPLALRYLGLLLRMDPQFNWFEVVAGNEPLLQHSIAEPERGKQRCTRQ